MRILLLASLSIITMLSIALPAHAQIGETDISISVKAHDAQFIGSAMSGAHILVKNKLTGDVLVSGYTSGDAGDTDLIMNSGQKRDAIIKGRKTASLDFSLEIAEPMPATITVTAPLGQVQSQVTASQDILFLPGKDYTEGNGILIEIPGMVVDVLSPPAMFQKQSNDRPVIITANVLKLDGSQIAKDSPWPPERYQVEAHIYHNEFHLMSFDMKHTGQPGLYTHNLKAAEAGSYKVVITAFDTKTKEAGIDQASFTITAPAVSEKEN